MGVFVAWSLGSGWGRNIYVYGIHFVFMGDRGAAGGGA